MLATRFIQYIVDLFCIYYSSKYRKRGIVKRQAVEIENAPQSFKELLGKKNWLYNDKNWNKENEFERKPSSITGEDFISNQGQEMGNAW